MKRYTVVVYDPRVCIKWDNPVRTISREIIICVGPGYPWCDLTHIYSSSIFCILIRQRRRMFQVKFSFLPYSCYKEKFIVTSTEVIQYIEKCYVKRLLLMIRMRINAQAKNRSVLLDLNSVVLMNAGFFLDNI